MAQLTVRLLTALIVPCAFAREAAELEEIDALKGIEELGATPVEALKTDSTPFESGNSIGQVDEALLQSSRVRQVSDVFRLLGNISAPSDVDTGFTIRGKVAEIRVWLSRMQQA